MRKTILLDRDGSVIKTKRPIKSLIQLDKLSTTKYVLIPIVAMDNIYIGVDGDFLQSFDMDKCIITYHMRSHIVTKSASRIEEEYSGYDYCTVQTVGYTIEEFYNLIHNVFVFNYVELMQHSTEQNMGLAFLEVADIRIEIYNNDRLIIDTEIICSDKDDIPFDIGTNSTIINDISTKFGIMGCDSKLFVMPTLLFKHNPDRLNSERWTTAPKGPIQLFSDIEKICIPHRFTNTYVIISDDAYDIALRMESGALFICPLEFYFCSISKPDYSLLSVTTTYNIDRYTFGDDETIDPCEYLVQALESNLTEIYVFEFIDTNDIIFAIEYIPNILENFCEIVKAMLTNDTGITDIGAFNNFATVLAEFRINIDDSEVLYIVTDAFQDHQPSIDDVCYLLTIEENQSNNLGFPIREE